MSRSVSILDMGCYEDLLPGKVDANSRNLSKRMFLYDRQRRKGESGKKPKPSPIRRCRRSPKAKASVANVETVGDASTPKPFAFDTPSPDDIVSAKQKMAFEHSSESTALSTSGGKTSTPSNATSDEGRGDRDATAKDSGGLIKAKPTSESTTDKRSGEAKSTITSTLSLLERKRFDSESAKDASPGNDSDDSGPDDWESHYFGS